MRQSVTERCYPLTGLSSWGWIIIWDDYFANVTIEK